MIYKISLPNIKYGHLMPPEDSLLIEENIFCVADGITRDPISPKNFSSLSIENALKRYPNPSGARLAADIFCESFTKYIKNKTISLKTVQTAFTTGNRKIKTLNKNNIKKVDYLVNDFFGCCASGGAIYKNKLYWGAICDCGIIIYDRNGKIKFQTPNGMEKFEKYEKKFLQKPNFNFTRAKYRKMIRSEYRNNIKNPFSYGALTGERTAEGFMNFDKIDLNKGDLIVFYSDGFEHTVKHKKFFKTIYQKNKNLADQHFIPYTLSLAKQDYHKFGRERTLIAILN